MGDAADRFQPPVHPTECSHDGGAMVWADDGEACWCRGCGQRWEMDRTAANRLRGWVPVGRQHGGG